MWEDCKGRDVSGIAVLLVVSSAQKPSRVGTYAVVAPEAFGAATASVASKSNAAVPYRRREKAAFELRPFFAPWYDAGDDVILRSNFRAQQLGRITGA